MSWSGVCVVCCADRLCGSVAACLGVVCVLCAVQNETELGAFFCSGIRDVSASS
jgi:hypothetical protein